MSTINSLTACIYKLAQLKQQPLDRYALLQAVDELRKSKRRLTPKQIVSQIGTKLGSPPGKLVRSPDPANMPLLAHHPKVGWLLVRGQNARQEWIMECWDSAKQQFRETKSRRSKLSGLMLFQLNLKQDFDSSQSPVFQLIKHELFSHRSKLAEIVIATISMNLLAIATSLYSMQVYNRVIPTNALQTLSVLTIGVLIAVIIEYVLKHARASISERLIDAVDQRLTRVIFMRFLSIRLDQLPSSVGSLAGQLNAYQSVRSFLTSVTTHLLVDLPFVFIFLMLIPFLGNSILVTIPVAFFLIALLMNLYNRKQVEGLASRSTSLGHFKTGLLVETIEGAETIKSGQAGWRMLNRWMSASDSHRQSEQHMRHITERNQHTTATMQQVSYVLLIALGAVLVSMGSMTQGGLVACSILAGRILSPIATIPALLMQWGQVKSAVQGLDRIWKLELDHQDQSHPIAPEHIRGHYKLEQVTSGYRGTQRALHIKDLVIRPGEKIGILGPIGSGKTTLLRLLSGMYKPQEGRVLLDNIDIVHLSKPVLAESIGFLQQDGRLFAGTLRDNLILGMHDPGDDRILAVAERTGLMKLVISNNPKGLMQEISEGGLGLSAGQKQLTNLTRVFLRRPSVWLLDEPTSSMDRQTEIQVLQALSESLRPSDTLVMVTHKTEMLPLVDRLIVVAQGQVVLDGPKDQVIERLQRKPQQPSTHLRPVSRAS